MPMTQPQIPDFWSCNAELHLILDQADANVPPNTLRNPATNYFDFNTQLLPDEPFLVGYSSSDIPLDGYNSTKQIPFDPALWPSDTTNQTPRVGDISTNTDLDCYFALKAPQSEQLVAPSDLTFIPDSKPKEEVTTPMPSTSTPQDPPVKNPKKRGRKRKQLDADAQVIHRKNFLERNRVAANRCREKRKTYVFNLNGRVKDLLAKNTFLRGELERLNEEVAALKILARMECRCNDELARNLRQRLSASGLGEEGVEAIVERFLRLKSEDFGTKAWVKEMKSLSRLHSRYSALSSFSAASSGGDDVFSPVGGKHEDSGESSSQSSSIEVDEWRSEFLFPLDGLGMN